MLYFQLILDSGCMRPRKTLNIAQYFSATRGELTYFSCNEKLMLRRKHLNLWDIFILCHRNAYPICFCCNNDRSEVFFCNEKLAGKQHIQIYLLFYIAFVATYIQHSNTNGDTTIRHMFLL